MDDIGSEVSTYIHIKYMVWYKTAYKRANYKRKRKTFDYAKSMWKPNLHISF